MKIKQRALPSGVVSYRAVYADPDTGRDVYETLDLAGLPTKEARRDWCIAKSRSIARRKMELQSGAPRASGKPTDKALDAFFDAKVNLAPRTAKIYETATDKLTAWCERQGIGSFDDLDRAGLMEFRTTLVRQLKRAPVRASKGGGRGSFRETKQRRSPVSVNQELRAVHTALAHLHDADLLPRLSRDDLRRALKPEKATREAIEFLRPAQCVALLEACMRHDAATVFGRADEQRARLEARELGIPRRSHDAKGTTPRFEPIAPYTAFVLLSGARAGEGLELQWRDVDLEHGEIRLQATAVKTRVARAIGLNITPQLSAMLAAMKLRAGKARYVFGDDAPLSRASTEAARARLVDSFAAPEFSWQLLRSTTATVQTNAVSLFGDASAWKSARRLGHSVIVAEKRYAGLLEVPKDATTLEACMGVTEVMGRLVDRLSGAAPRSNVIDIGAAR